MEQFFRLPSTSMKTIHQGLRRLDLFSALDEDKTFMPLSNKLPYYQRESGWKRDLKSFRDSLLSKKLNLKQSGVTSGSPLPVGCLVHSAFSRWSIAGLSRLLCLPLVLVQIEHKTTKLSRQLNFAHHSCKPVCDWFVTLFSTPPSIIKSCKMKLYFLYLSALTVGALCKIDDVCLAKSVKRSFFRLLFFSRWCSCSGLLIWHRCMQGKKGVLGKCQKKSECMKAGLAAFSKSGRTGVSGTLEELACSGGELPLPYTSPSSPPIIIRADKCACKKDDAEVQCCVEIKCGSHNCRNNVESNSCAEGAYVANFR